MFGYNYCVSEYYPSSTMSRNTVTILICHRHEVFCVWMMTLYNFGLYCPAFRECSYLQLHRQDTCIAYIYIYICNKCKEVIISVYRVSFNFNNCFYLNEPYIYYEIMFCYKIFINKVIRQFVCK